ncbi:MAG: hypothetical protein GF308_21495 [Candidatus Heimdallarchaeota archaeon]|nr:hypothetical protein [Candidatus Heimdallarchaeota archaeon]
MPEKKETRGRPRKYATNAERQKAYYERKKKRRKELERKVRKLEEAMIKTEEEQFRFIDMDFERETLWKRYTPEEIATMTTPEILKNLKELKELVAGSLSLNNPLQRIILGTVIGFSTDSKEGLVNSSELPEIDINKGLADFVEVVQQLTQIHFLEAEIASRERKMGKVDKREKLAALEKGIKELVQEKSEDKEIKLKQK